jgi:hypothetical protein
MTRKRIVRALAVLAVTGCPWVPAEADITLGGSSQITSFFNSGASFLIQTLGAGVFLYGMIAAAIRISYGDDRGFQKLITVCVGGAVLFLAPSIVGVLKTQTGSLF